LDYVPSGTSTKSLEVRFTDEHDKKLQWLKKRLNISGNGVFRIALEVLYVQEAGAAAQGRAIGSSTVRARGMSAR
jgi:hypothetical protein